MRSLFSFILIGTILLLNACEEDRKPSMTNSFQSEIKTLKDELERKKQELTQVQTDLQAMEQEVDAPLVHIVLFKLKKRISELDKSMVIKKLNKLEQIKEVKEFRLGMFKDLGDKRALSEYDIVIEMRFTDSNEYQAYQRSSIHQQVKKELKSSLAGAPASYDYVIK